MRHSSRFLNPAYLRNIQDTLYAALFCGVALAFMLFLLGSTSIMTSLLIIGILLCLSLAGSVLRFFSLARTDRELLASQTEIEQGFKTLQHRVNDHDLMFLDLSGKIDGLAAHVAQVQSAQAEQAITQQNFMRDLKARFLTLAGRLTHRGDKKSAPAADLAPLQKTMRTLPQLTANDAPAPARAIRKFDPIDDVVVSPTLLREAVQTAIVQERIDLYLQPVAMLPSRRVYAYDVTGRVRLKAGVYIPVRDYRGVATHDGNMPLLDRLVIKQLAAQHHFAVPVFMNLHGGSLTHRGAMLELAQLIRARPDLAQHLTIYLNQHDFNRLDESQEKMIGTLRHYGVKLGVNDVSGPDLDMNRLTQYGFQFLKIPYTRLMNGVETPAGAAVTQRFMTRLQTRNIKLIVGQIEDEGMIKKMLDFPVELAQGYAISRPDRPVAFTKKVA